MKLVIVESPVKSKTIARFLDKDYSVASSYGHIRDLPAKELGVDVKNNFEPKYVIPDKAKKRVAELKKQASKAKEIILAVDEDREGEAIAFHIAHILKLENPKRIVFHEITKKAIEDALKKPRGIDINLVNAQQARRILDRLVGYKLSPFLWKKVVRGLSAGRVQSVAVRLICEREKEIEQFKPEEYWTISAFLAKQNDKIEFEAILAKKDDKPITKLGIKTKRESEKILNDLEKAEYKIENIEKKETARNPLPPFRTSTVQQTAVNKLHFSAKQTMMLAQKLYEYGFITYHRTDSLNLSSQSQQAAAEFIQRNLGKQYWPGFARNYRTKAKGAQEAHEAIRPAYPEKTADMLKSKLDSRQYRLYDLIWQRFIASQMSPALFNSMAVEIKAKNYTFKANGQTLKFDGFLKIYKTSFEENELPELEKNEILDLKKLSPDQHFTQPPARYSEAGLIKVLEKEGIGRPSTYAPILDTIQNRNYVEKNENKKFEPTHIGKTVNDLLVEHFPKIVNVEFTANMEKEFDEIAEGKDTYVKTLQNFYEPFEKNLKEKEEKVEKTDLTEKTDKICPECKSPIIIRWGRFGKFYACSNFPKCKHTENLPKPSLGIKCPKCEQGELVEKTTKKRKTFYGCPNWPDCDFALWDKPINEKCPECNSLLIETNRKIVKCSDKNCGFVKPKAGGIKKK